MAQINIETTGIPEGDDTFTVQWEATLGTDSLPDEIFVFKRATQEFDHVATVADLAFPTTPDPTLAFYRESIGTANYPSIADADAGKLAVNSAIQSLVDNYTDDFDNSFSGSDGGILYTPTP
jgi:hypothetical protein